MAAIMKVVGQDVEVMLPANALVSKHQKIVTQQEAVVIISKRNEVNKRLSEATQLLLPKIEELVDKKIQNLGPLLSGTLQDIVNASFSYLKDAALDYYSEEKLYLSVSSIFTDKETLFKIYCKYNDELLLEIAVESNDNDSITDHRKKISNAVRSIICRVGYKLTIGDAGKQAVVITPVPPSKSKKQTKKQTKK